MVLLLVSVNTLQLNTLIVVILQMVQILVKYVGHMLLGFNLGVLDLMELTLLVLQVKHAILSHHLVDVLLLNLDIVINSTILKQGPLDALMDALLRIFSLLLELHAIIVLGVSTLPHHVGLGFVALRLLLMHLLDELLLPI